MSLGGKALESAHALAECLTWQPCPHRLPQFVVPLVVALGILAYVGHFVGAYEGGAWLLRRLRSGKRLPPQPPNHALRRARFCASLLAALAGLAKAENWDDRYFTDLEAEAETSSLRGRWLRRGSLRRVPSIITEIEKARTVYVLEGEPGSGKSVALRVLAKQYAERARNSSDPRAKVPLYVNLRDLPAVPPVKVDGEFLKSFVLQNVRRGYADNTAFVEENWDEYAQRGLWLFLLDSFDEIPEILRGENSDAAIAKYSIAIRELIGGTGCRGVVASRKFNGPVDLPWPKLVIVELSARRQDQLIARSPLSRAQRTVVRRYLAARASYTRGEKTIGANPFLLSLLCAYVKKHDHPLENDFDLVVDHLRALAEHGADDGARASLPPEALVRYAEDVAVVFGGTPLTLPRASIVTALGALGIPEHRADQVLVALVEVKILTADAHAVSPSEQRFAFAHRRYQETLLVRHIARDAGYVAPRRLLELSSWREYAVTLLQTQEPRIVEWLLGAAKEVLDERAVEQRPHPITPELGIDPALQLGYFDWKDEPGVPLLELLQEGLARRMHDVPPRLGLAVLAFLRPRWDGGDFHDRTGVVRLGGLLPQPDLHAYLASAFASRTPLMQRAAFTQATFLANVPVEMAREVRGRLADAILVAHSELEVLRIEALAARLPEWLEVDQVIRRCRVLRAMLAPFRPITAVVIRLVRLRGLPPRIVIEAASGGAADFRVMIESSVATALMPLYAIVGELWNDGLNGLPIRIAVAVAAYCAFASIVLSLFCVRAFGRVTSLDSLVSNMASMGIRRDQVIALIVVLAFGAVTLTSVRLGTVTLFSTALLIVVASMWFAFFAYIMVAAPRGTGDAPRPKAVLSRLRKRGLIDAAIVAQARSVQELTSWLEAEKFLLARDVVANRSVSRVLQEVRKAPHLVSQPEISWLRDVGGRKATLARLDVMLEDRLTEALAANGGLLSFEVEGARP
jgi:hypothetical protein